EISDTSTSSGLSTRALAMNSMSSLSETLADMSRGLRERGASWSGGAGEPFGASHTIAGPAKAQLPGRRVADQRTRWRTALEGATAGHRSNHANDPGLLERPGSSSRRLRLALSGQLACCSGRRSSLAQQSTNRVGG